VAPGKGEVNSELLSAQRRQRLEIAQFDAYKATRPTPNGDQMQAVQPNSPPRSRAFAIRAIATLVAAAVLGVAAFMLASGPQRSRAALIGGAFSLQAGDGKIVSDQTLRGRPFLVYFGYTHCPDVCPTELARISDILNQMGDKPIPALFITVDPERDTPQIMQDYVSSFNPAIVGLSGSQQAVEAAEKTFRVFARKGEKQPDGDYSMDHSSIVYLMDKNGAFVEAFNLQRPPQDSAKDLERFL
jgi:protein SCO1